MSKTDAEAINWNKSRHSKEDIRKVQAALGATPDGIWGMQTQLAVEQWQFDHGLKPDGLVGKKTMAAMLADDGTPPMEDWRHLTDEEVDLIIRFTVEEEAGSADPYDDMNTNNEYEGWHDTPYKDENGRKMNPAEREKYRQANPGSGEPHRASQFHSSGGYYIGLTGGFIQFAQSPGSLGKVMKIAQGLDPNEFALDFGPNHGQMVRTLNAGKGNLKSLRGPNTQPIGGKDMWEKPWTTRFDVAASKDYFRKAQRIAARKSYFDPAVELCKAYGFSGQGELAVTFDMCVQFGAGGCKRRYKKAKKAHGDAMTILDVIDEIKAPHRRNRRLRIIEKSETFVVYLELVPDE